MRRAFLVVLIVVLALMLIVCAISLYMRISMRHMGFLTPSDVDKLLSMVNEEVKKAQASGCSFPIDTSSLGDQKQEEQMLRVASLLDLHYVEFNRSVSSIEDLDVLGGFNRDLQSNINDLKNHCVISANFEVGTVVSCGMRKPAVVAFPVIPRNTPPTERFYEIGSNEILFIPAPKCRTLPSGK